MASELHKLQSTGQEYCSGETVKKLFNFHKEQSKFSLSSS